MKTPLIIAIAGLSLFLIVGCSGPSPEEVVNKTADVVPRAQELMLSASFSPDEACREMAGEFAEEYDVDQMPYGGADLAEQLAKLEELESGLDQFEQDLEEAGCNS